MEGKIIAVWGSHHSGKTTYLDYRKHGQFEWTAPAILLGTLIFSLTCPLYIWSILGM